MRLAATLLLSLGLVSGAAHAASPEDDYVAQRDKDIATIKSLTAAKADDKTVMAEEEAMRADLLKRLAAILGPFTVVGFPAAGALSPETLSASDIGYGMLDGIMHWEGDNGPQVLVTTRPLVERWLRAKSADEVADDRLPADIEAALRDDRFYTDTLMSDAAFSKTADLAIVKPKGADFVVAELGGFTQDIGPNPNQRIVVALQKGARFYVASLAPKTPIAADAACKAIWSAATKKAEAMRKAFRQAGGKDDKLFDESTKLEDRGDADYRRCLVKRAPQKAFYPGLVREAQELADRLAGP